MTHQKEEQSLIIFKPDGVQRGVVGEILSRFERVGLKIIGMKMLHMDDSLLKEHYGKYESKPFFAGLTQHMTKSPIVAMVISGVRAISATRLIVGPTKGYEADAGSIRGDFSLSVQSNLIHASDPKEDPEAEIARFFSNKEIFDYQRIDFDLLYGNEELE